MTFSYARFVPSLLRRIIEFLLLVKACLSLCLLIYVHFLFVRSPITCLDHLRDSNLSPPCNIGDQNCSALEFERYFPATRPKDFQRWPRVGVLRVEIISDPPNHYDLIDSYAVEYPYLYPEVHKQSNTIKEDEVTEYWDTSALVFDQVKSNVKWGLEEMLKKFGFVEKEPEPTIQESFLNWTAISQNLVFYRDRFLARLKQLIQEAPSKIESLSNSGLIRNRFVMEYSLYHGLLRLQPSIRESLNISTKLVVLDPYKHQCFGNQFTHFLLDDFLGYNDLLIASFKRLSGNEPAEGYVRNVVDGSYYRFVNMSNSPTSYLGAFFAMMMFVRPTNIFMNLLNTKKSAGRPHL
ncbi:hypothetical protein Ciccas_005580 [Cichlidogyrus casuarinus]|uniref:Uncharacterized protein n=1 Tax=Cichlidogyrus casuarinus TaxID=1844966 RepID=A0ABD2QBX5_9PLAT